MSEQKQTPHCEKCQNELTGKFCSNCGSAQVLKRIDGTFILSEILSILNFDKGILYTIRELLTRPGQNIRDFIHRERRRLVKPIFFMIICSVVYTATQQFVHFDDKYITLTGFDESATASIFNWIQNNYGYGNILMAIFIAFWIKVFFKKYDYNFFEILTLLCFVIGMGMLIYTIFGVAESLSKVKVMYLGGLVGFVYFSWAIGQFFDERKKINFLKGFLSYFLGMLSFTLVAIITGITIDLVKKI